LALIASLLVPSYLLAVDFLEPWAMNTEMWTAWVVYWMVSAFFTHKTKKSEGLLGRLAHIIPLYIGLFLIFHSRHYSFFIGRLDDNTGVEAIGDVLTFSGLAFTVWARVHLGRYWSGIITLKEGHKLIRTGPYALVRHPIYTGMIVAAIGSVLGSTTGDAVLGFPFVLLGLLPKARNEEKILTGEFGEEYQRYKREVPALIPYKAAWNLLTSIFRRDSGGAIPSPAFGTAALRSEQYRITGILLVVGFLVVLLIGRSIVDPKHHDYQRVGTALGFYFSIAAYETLMLWIARRFERRGRAPRPWVWAVNTIVECSFPTIMIFALTLDKGNVGPYRALVSSQVFFYYFFIILATLRLRPRLCVLSGFVSSCGYVLVYLFTQHYFPHENPKDTTAPETFILSPILLFGSGIVAAAVAYRLRSHVMAALQEAETRRKLDRMEYDLNVARAIQMGLLPRRSPTVAGYDIAGFSQPADQTGGDYYDWIELPDGRIILTIADATGHGIGPALLIAACRAYFRAIATGNDPLESVAARMDELVAADVPDGRFITAAVALLDPANHRLSLYSAGQAPIYLYEATTGQLNVFDADQPPLGLCYDSNGTHARTISLAPGDALVLVTDGFFEYADKAGEHFGSTRVGESIVRHHRSAASEIIGQLREEVTAFSGGSAQADDLTAVVVKRAESRTA
jgi:serine phosphatase RsbU (regulator of sigma subunit)/protein-S-isoprenylcysteine O-methyltransferase Ste14